MSKTDQVASTMNTSPVRIHMEPRAKDAARRAGGQEKAEDADVEKDNADR